jgi:hypothetical protein
VQNRGGALWMADLLTVGAVRTSPLVSGSYVMRFGSVAVINTVVVFFFWLSGFSNCFDTTIRSL